MRRLTQAISSSRSRAAAGRSPGSGRRGGRRARPAPAPAGYCGAFEDDFLHRSPAPAAESVAPSQSAASRPSDRPPWSPRVATPAARRSRGQPGRAQQAAPPAQPEPQRRGPRRRRLGAAAPGGLRGGRGGEAPVGRAGRSSGHGGPAPPSRRRARGKPCRQCAACSGSSEVGVRPGWVLTSSSTRRPGSPARVVVAEIRAAWRRGSRAPDGRRRATSIARA